jgi:hypothetical protein
LVPEIGSWVEKFSIAERRRIWLAGWHEKAHQPPKIRRFNRNWRGGWTFPHRSRSSTAGAYPQHRSASGGIGREWQ